SIYYVNTPSTSSADQLNVQLSNPAPLVLHVFAVAGSDVTSPPIFSSITDPGAGNVSANVASAAISVPNDTLLLAWTKNETTANAVDGFILDPQSTSFLWGESETALAAGSYGSEFVYSSPIGWQTAIVGLKVSGTGTPPAPTFVSTPSNPTNQTNAAFSFSDT